VLGNISMDGGNVSIGGSGIGLVCRCERRVVCDGRESVLWRVYASEVSAFGGTVVIDGTVC
jgi:hypothetical protein